MKQIIALLLILMLPAMQMQAQIINKRNKSKIGQSIKNGVNSALETIEQDAHPTGVHEQWEAFAGPKLGLGISSLPGAGGKPELGIIAGGFAEVFVAKNLSISFELNFQHQGANSVKYSELRDVTDESGNTTQVVNAGKYDYNLNYINTLYLIHWYPWPYRALSFYTGLQLSRMVSAKSHMHGSTTVDIKDQLHKGEFDIPIGVSYEWKQWQFEGRYFISPRELAKSHRAKQIIGNARNMALSFTVAYRIQMF